MAVGTEFVIDQLKYVVLTESGTTGTVSVGAKDTSITGDIVIPETVSNGGITYTVTIIRDDAFYSVNDITSIYIPSTIITSPIGWNTFVASKLRSINVDPNNNNYSSEDGILYSKTKNTLYKYPPNKLEKIYYCPDTIKLFKIYSCYNSKFNYINLPNNNDNIYETSVFGQSKLIDINITSGGIARALCNGSNLLKKLNLNSSNISSQTFNTTSLRKVTIGSNVTTGSFDAFVGSNNIETVNVDSQYVVDHFKDFFPQITSSTSPLRYVNIGDSVTSIGDNAFSASTEYYPSIKEINIGKNVQTIGDYSFERTFASDSQINKSGYINIPNSVNYIGNKAFHNDKLYKLLLPNSITNIHMNALFACYANIIEFNCNITNIPQGFFSWSDYCRKYIINSNITQINTDGFNASHVSSIIFPNTLTSIGNKVFARITHNKFYSIIFNGNCPTTGSNTFSGSNITNLKIYYYQDTIGWNSTFTEYNVPTQKVFRGEVTSGNYTYKFVDGIGGTPNVSVRVANNIKLTLNSAPPQTVTIDGLTYTVRYIADNGFENQYNLGSFDFHNQYLEIGKNAFKGCRNLTTVSNTNGITDIGESAFEGCSKLTSFSIQTITDVYHPIEKNTFKDCKKLQSITLSSYCYDIKESAFENCTSLQSINIPNECNHIYQNAFRNCSSLQSVTYGTNLYIIYDNAFMGCNSLRTFTTASGATNNLETLKDNVFANCYRLESAPLGAIRDIGKYCFYYNQALTSITLPATTDYVDDCAFANCNHLTELINNSPQNAEFGNDVFVGSSVSL